jgi:hypothetical protein
MGLTHVSASKSDLDPGKPAVDQRVLRMTWLGPRRVEESRQRNHSRVRSCCTRRPDSPEFRFRAGKQLGWSQSSTQIREASCRRPWILLDPYCFASPATSLRQVHFPDAEPIRQVLISISQWYVPHLDTPTLSQRPPEDPATRNGSRDNEEEKKTTRERKGILSRRSSGRDGVEHFYPLPLCGLGP